MAVESRHPDYLKRIEDWEQMRDTFEGQRKVKERGFRYLPATSGMKADGLKNDRAPGFKAYSAYRTRAYFPELVGDAIEAMLGIMHYKPPAIELPAKLESMRERATIRNESLDMLLRRINEEQLVSGRLGMLLEVPDQAPVDRARPYVALYRAEDIVNWDDGARDETQVDALNLVVIDETEDERVDRYEWERVEKYRVLMLGDLVANEQPGSGVPYSVAVVRKGGDVTPETMKVPSIAGSTLDRIPFVFVNTKDIVATPDDPPMLGLSNLSLVIYRSEADYRQALFMQGQDTLVTIGGVTSESDELRTGAGARLDLPMGGDAKYIGVSSLGLSELRSALENDYKRGDQRAGALLEAVSRAAESGEALRVRVAARTASLNQIALTGAFALQELLRIAAVWVGANPDEVIVTPNLDFVADTMSGQELAQAMGAKQLGAPWSLASIHASMHARGLTDLTFEEELEQMRKEAEEGLPGATPATNEDDAGSTNPDGPEDEEEDEPNEDDEDEQDGDDGRNQPPPR